MSAVQLLRIFFAVLAAYRLAYLISSEEGPYFFFLYRDIDQRGIFAWLRQKAGAYNYIYDYDSEGNDISRVATNIGRGISCPHCVGAYTTLLLVFLLFFDNMIINFLIYWLGFWGAQRILENISDL